MLHGVGGRTGLAGKRLPMREVNPQGDDATEFARPQHRVCGVPQQGVGPRSLRLTWAAGARHWPQWELSLLRIG